jgi:hypothetical protein
VDVHPSLGTHLSSRFAGRARRRILLQNQTSTVSRMGNMVVFTENHTLVKPPF